MPMCMWASTHPGNARRFLPSKTSLPCSAGTSGASSAILPSLTAISRASTDVLLGRTTRALLITRSNGFSMGSHSKIRAFEVRVVADISRRSLHDEDAVLEDIGAARHLKALHHVLFDQQHRYAFRIDAP